MCYFSKLLAHETTAQSGLLRRPGGQRDSLSPVARPGGRRVLALVTALGATLHQREVNTFGDGTAADLCENAA